MPRPLRIEYPGAIYHVINRGDHREAVFRDDEDRSLFLRTLEQACGKTGWEIHAWCLMSNHFHLVMETPRGNLSAGMKWLLGTYTQRYNLRHKLNGHLFQGRYKAHVIDGEKRGYLRIACDYVHLNPVRAQLLEPERPMSRWRWSSYREYLLPARQRSGWLRTDRLLGEHGIEVDGASGRRRFEKVMEERRLDEEGENEVVQSLRRGWRLGAEDFLERLLDKVAFSAVKNQQLRTSGETEQVLAERIVREEVQAAGREARELPVLRKGDALKVRIARRLRAETSLTLGEIAALLHMGAGSHVSHLLFRKSDGKTE
jgi:REP element-mobilizing transposase RayT